MTSTYDLSAFLASRRAAIAPESLGLPSPPGSRRSSGLRRVDVALLAGVSVDYYIKFEQGRATNVSEHVIQAIERTLRLDEVERKHLRALLHRSFTSKLAHTETLGPAVPRPGSLTILHSLGLPAMLIGPCLEVLGLNDAGKHLIDDFDAMPLPERNFARWLFLNPRARIVYTDWSGIASRMTAMLRCASIGAEHNPYLERIVEELKFASSEFASIWSEYRVHEAGNDSADLFNEKVGRLSVNFDTLRLPELGQSIMVTSADPGSPSEAKLKILVEWDPADHGALGAHQPG